MAIAKSRRGTKSVAPDLAALVRRVEELSAALAAQKDYVAAVGTELRNAVAPLMLLAHEMERDAVGAAEDPAWVARRVANLTTSLGTFIGVVDRAVDIGRLRDGRVDLDLSDVDLAHVAAGECARSAREAAAGGAELRLDAPIPVIGRWDRSRLEQITRHLVGNAIRYGGGGTIEITARGDAASGRLVVQDRGSATSSDDRARISDAFDRPRRGAAGGFGVGLWVVKTLCEAMAGTISFETPAAGGARFNVTLPRG